MLFTYLHLAADERLTKALVESGATCIAYETVQARPSPAVARPMSEVPGDWRPRWAPGRSRRHTAAGEASTGSRSASARVIVLGGGVVGYNAALIAVGMQSDVWVLDRSVERMRELEMMLDGRITLAMSSRLQIEEALPGADLVIGAVLIPGAGAEARDARHAADPEAGRGSGRRRDRPGRPLRDLHDRPRTPILSSPWTASCTTAWPTCPEPCRSRPRKR